MAQQQSHKLSVLMWVRVPSPAVYTKNKEEKKMAETVKTVTAKTLDLESLSKFTQEWKEVTQMLNSTNENKFVQDLVGTTGVSVELAADGSYRMFIPHEEKTLVTSPVRSAKILENGVIRIVTDNSIYTIQKGVFMDKNSINLYKDMPEDSKIEIAIPA